MKYIGFTNVYYTLWEVENKGRWTYYTYIKNISKDFEKAKEKEPIALINLSLRGHSSYRLERKEYFADEFQFGKYVGTRYADCTDYDYMKWYYNNAEKEHIKINVKPFLEKQGYKFFRDVAMTCEQYDVFSKRFPSWEQKLMRGEEFHFYPKKGLNTYGEIDITFCNLCFKEWHELNGTYVPRGCNGNFINNLITIEDYEYKRLSPIKFQIIVNKWKIGR